LFMNSILAFAYIFFLDHLPLLIGPCGDLIINDFGRVQFNQVKLSRGF
jgi:hypothetical protein